MNRLDNGIPARMSPADRPNIPDELIAKWQTIVNLMAEILGIRAGLIVKLDPPQIEVFVASATEGNPFKKGERANLNTGLYCETVMAQRSPLLIPDAREDPKWNHNPDIELGMISYLGFPLLWPDGEVFGTICLLDSTKKSYTKVHVELTQQFSQLVEAHLRLLTEITERKQMEEQLKRRTHDLGERVKELNCLYGISKIIETEDISLEGIIQEIADLIPPSWQYPEITCARVNLGGQLFKTDNFEETIWKQSKEIKVYGERIGRIEVFYLEERPEADEGPFLNEGRYLINAIAERTGRIIEYSKAEEALRKTHDQLEQKVKERTAELAVSNEQLKREITERKRAERRVRQSNTMFQAVFDGILDPLIMVDKNLAVKLINKAGLNYYKLDECRDILGKSCYQILKGRASPCEGCELSSLISAGQPVRFERKGCMDPDKFERVEVYPMRELNGKAFLHLSDITDEKIIQRQLLQREKLASLGLLVSGIAHEINNPNSFITLNIPTLRDYLKELIPITDQYAEDHQDYELFGMSYAEFREDIFKLLRNIEHGSQRINNTLSALREFSRRKEKLEPVWVDVKEMIDKALVMSRGLLEGMVKSLELNILEDLPRIRTDPAAVEQVVINLLINAAQAADKEDSWIKLNVAAGDKSGNGLAIDVIDNGSGIDEKTRTRIFDPFFTTKAPGEGTGLGLYVCQQLIEGLGGRIEVESEPGMGSTFRVILPANESNGGNSLQN